MLKRGFLLCIPFLIALVVCACTGSAPATPTAAAPAAKSADVPATATAATAASSPTLGPSATPPRSGSPTSTPPKSAATPTAAQAASDFGDIPLYPGAKIEPKYEEDMKRMAASMSKGPIGDEVVRVLVTGDKPADVVRFYSEQMPNRGWKSALSLAGDEGGYFQWKKDTLVAQLLVGVTEGQTTILISRGDASAPTPTPKAYTAQSALALAKPLVGGWSQDAILVKISGGTGYDPVSPEGQSSRWQFEFYSPSEKKARGVQVGKLASGESQIDSSSSSWSGEKEALEGWMDSPQLVAAAEALGGKEQRARYSDLTLWYSIVLSKKQPVCTVTYLSETAQKAGTMMGVVLRFQMDGKTGQLIKIQMRDGKEVK